MKKLIVLSFLVLIACEKKLKVSVLEAPIACGQCMFELDSEEGCTLAVKILDKPYFVDGFNIDDFGDAHDENTGFCNVIRTGKITGSIKNDKFLASDIKLDE
jgi:hypothetical protein